MSRLPAWLPDLLNRINSGLASSPLLARLNHDAEAVETGRSICRDLWPFIKDLAGNVAAVRDSLPDSATAAGKLLSQLADDERHYQSLFRKQCHLAGLTDVEIDRLEPSPQTRALCAVLDRYARHGSCEEGIYAIVTAEFAATAFCRAAMPHYERYFAAYGHFYDPELMEEGLSWLRLHAQPNPRHAIWLKRMLDGIGAPDTATAPPPAEEVLQAVLALWRCPAGGVSARAVAGPTGG